MSFDILQGGFNAANFEPATKSYDLLPDGWYQAMIIDSEVKPTKAGTGHYLQMTIEVTDGEHAGRYVWDRLNLDNPNETAVAIAQETLAQICHAVGVLDPKETEELHHKPMEVRVGIQPAKGQYNESNIVKGYRAAQDAPKKEAAAKKAPAVSLAEPDDELPF